MACVMNWSYTAAQSASPDTEIQEQMTKFPREVYLVPCLECHFAGIVPGSALRGQCHQSLLVYKGDNAQLLGTALEALGLEK